MPVLASGICDIFKQAAIKLIRFDEEAKRYRKELWLVKDPKITNIKIFMHHPVVDAMYT
jgi:hypothetical protein